MSYASKKRRQSGLLLEFGVSNKVLGLEGLEREKPLRGSNEAKSEMRKIHFDFVKQH